MDFFRICITAGAGFWLAACGDNDSPPNVTTPIDAFLPAIPEPTGEAQKSFAGSIKDANKSELIAGPATSGLVGDFFMRNDKVRFVIQAPGRVIGVVPQGGNLIDATAVPADGSPEVGDQFGELSMMYKLGRTCDHQTLEVVRDGSAGGVSAIVAKGMTAPNDYINIKGVGPIYVAGTIDPDIPDLVECATTYILQPGASELEIYFTLYNGGMGRVEGPMAMLSDTGGNIGAFSPNLGFDQLLDLVTVLGGGASLSTNYEVYQAPDIAYGVVPVHEDPEVSNSPYFIAGVSVLILGVEKFTEILQLNDTFVQIAPGAAMTQKTRFMVGRDAGDIEEQYQASLDRETVTISGHVSWDDNSDAEQVRVSLFVDNDENGTLENQDVVRTFTRTDASGDFSFRVLPGKYLLRADVEDKARSAVFVATAEQNVSNVEMELPRPVRYDYTITDGDTGNPIPARITVVGQHSNGLDFRVFPTSDRVGGIFTTILSIRGTSLDGADFTGDSAIELPVGSDYRVFVSRGAEWSIANTLLTPQSGDPAQNLDFTLYHVVDTTNYVSSEYHVHSIGSPDSPVPLETRVSSAATEGVEVFASTEHDYINDLQPVIEKLDLQSLVRSIAGEEITPFVYGHFIGFPFVPDPNDPARGAIDWAKGMGGFAMTPGEIFDAMRAKGAELVQVCHPRATPGNAIDFQQYFDRVRLSFDYAARFAGGELAEQSIPNDYLRLPPGVSAWSDSFNMLEVWNSLDTEDTNGDGVREAVSLDQVMRDWMNFLLFGKNLTPAGNSDTHTRVKDPMGIPRNYVRVDADDALGLESGSVVDSVLATLTGKNNTPVDLVVTNGPMIHVTVEDEPALGKTFEGTGGEITVKLVVESADWADFDTVEVFANTGLPVNTNDTVLQPMYCFTTRDVLASNDPCKLAVGGAKPLVTAVETVGPGAKKLRATLNITVKQTDLPVVPSGVGEDAWVVFRARGDIGMFPIQPKGMLNTQNFDTFVNGSDADRRAAQVGKGLPASAFTSPIFIDFDGGGYKAQLAP